MPAFENIHFIINPAAGKPEPVLSTINSVLHPHDIAWRVWITQTDGDGRRLAEQALADGADLVVSYGGDGTVKDVVNGLINADVPMAILHGGTGNAMAYELGIPPSLEDAVNLIVNEHELRSVDIGQAVCTDAPDDVGYFVLRMSMGLQTKILDSANREMKTRWGNLAYVVASLQELRGSKQTTYQIKIDGEMYEGQGLTALVANSAFVGGQANFSFLPSVDPCDGKLDVMILDDSFANAMQVIGSALQIDGVDMAQYWSGTEIEIHAPEGELVTLDGEIFGKTPVKATLLAQAVQIVVPVMDDIEKGIDNS